MISLTHSIVEVKLAIGIDMSFSFICKRTPMIYMLKVTPPGPFGATEGISVFVGSEDHRF